jgi:hypothetical protein
MPGRYGPAVASAPDKKYRPGAANGLTVGATEAFAACAEEPSTFGHLASTRRHPYRRGMGIRAQLIARTEAELTRVRGELARPGEDDLPRESLLEREAELTRLLDDLEDGNLSPDVLAEVAHVGAGVPA